MVTFTSSEQNDSQGTVSVSLKGNPTDQGLALKEVAEALVSTVDAPLRAYASTIPVTRC